MQRSQCEFGPVSTGKVWRRPMIIHGLTIKADNDDDCALRVQPYESKFADKPPRIINH